MTNVAARPARRYLQFRLKTLFVLVLVAAIPCGWLKWKMDRKAKEREVVAEIRKLGGSVIYDWNLFDMTTMSEVGTPPGPPWLRRLFGDDCLANVRSVSAPATTTDNDLAALTAFRELKRLELTNTQISDAGLGRLVQNLTQLQYLLLAHTDVTDSSVIRLKMLTRLKLLDIRNTAATKAGVAELQKALPTCKIYR